VNHLARGFAVFGWLGLVVALAQGCAALDGVPVKAPKVSPDDARAAYKLALTACIACQLPDLPADAVKGCDELAPVCDALAGVCK
jgi:hypothetical protein